MNPVTKTISILIDKMDYISEKDALYLIALIVTKTKRFTSETVNQK